VLKFKEMITEKEQEVFINLVKLKLSEKEQAWLVQKTTVLSDIEKDTKFAVFFSLTARFISNEVPKWSIEELKILEDIYPGFGKALWTKQDLVRSVLMMVLDVASNKSRITTLFEIAEMHELIGLYRGLFLLKNAKEFSICVEEGIRTNMVNVFDAIIAGNPFAKTYLEEWAWNQLVLKALFLDRNLYTIQFIDQGKNKNLAGMLQDYVKERWAANRTISPEIWRMIHGYLREDVKEILIGKEFFGIEKEAIACIIDTDENCNTSEFWNRIGSLNKK
jgi:hypothetical protein